MVVRKFQRFPVTITTTLTQRDKLQYTGSVKDLSQKGCRIESVIRPFTGMQLELHLQLPGESVPITIGNAAIRWTGIHGIGCEFLSVVPAEQERLNRFLAQLSAKVGRA